MAKIIKHKSLHRKTDTHSFTHANGADKFVHASTFTSSEGNKVISSPGKKLEWKEAAAWVVKAHSGAWKRLED